MFFAAVVVWSIFVTKIAGLFSVCTFVLQTGPESGVDRVKKGGSYMCIKVGDVSNSHSSLTFLQTLT